MRKSKLGAFTKDEEDGDEKDNTIYDEKESMPNKTITRSKNNTIVSSRSRSYKTVNEKDKDLKKPASTRLISSKESTSKASASKASTSKANKMSAISKTTKTTDNKKPQRK